MSESTVRAINIAVLSFCSLEAFVMLASFQKFMLQIWASRIFFAKMLVTAFTMICYTISFIHDPEPRDALNTLTLALAFIGIYVIKFLYMLYLKVQINDKEKEHPVPMAFSYVAIVVTVIGALLWVLSIFDTTFSNLSAPILRIGPYYWIGHAGGFVLIAMSVMLLIRYHKTLGTRQTIVLFSMPVLLLAATFLEPFAQGIELRYPCIMLEFLIVYTQHHLDMENQVMREETESLHDRLALASGRMKPHYLYNVLTTIYYLCESDPQKAQYAIGTFSEYLRSTLETMERQEMVDFSWELGQIRHYLALEKMRFGDRLHVEYDTEVDDFKVPPLSVQPLVENAVKHGIAARQEGGTVRIVSRRLSDGGAQIRVIDDGVGFDITTLRTQDVTHEGVANVRERIRIECGGEMTITSAPGKGTTATITLRPHSGK